MKTWLSLSLLGGVIALAVWPLFIGRFYAIGDMRDVFIPIEHFYHQELLAGRIPAWWPEAAWGFPIIAAAQIGFFYPPLLVVRWLPLQIYLPLTVLTHLALTALGMWLLLRRLALSQAAAYLGALSFTLSAFIWQHFTHLNILLGLTWLPWQFLLAHHLHTATKRRRAWGGLALVLGLPFLAGQLQVPLLMALVTSTYIFYLFWQSERQIKQPLLYIAGLAIVVFGLAAVQLLPTYELAQYSSRGAAGSFNIQQANQHSYPLYHLPALLWPRFFGTDNTYWGKRLEIEYGFFIGTLPLLLASWASWRQWRQHTWWLGLGLISFLLSLGDMSPFRLIGLEPSLWYFSAPARWLLFTTLAGSVLAAYGFDLMQQYPEQWRKFLSRVGVLIAVLVLIVLIVNVVLLNRQTLLQTAIPWVLSYIQPSDSQLAPEYYSSKLASLVHSLNTSSVSLQSPYTWLPLLAIVGLVFTPRRRLTQFVILATTIELLIIASTTTPTLPWSTILDRPSSFTALPAEVQTAKSRLVTIRPPGGDTGAWLTNPESRTGAEGREQQRQLLVPLVHTQFQILGVEWPASLDLIGQSEFLDALKQGPHRAELARTSNIGAITQVEPDGHISTTTISTIPRATYQEELSNTSHFLPVEYISSQPTAIRLQSQAPQPGWVIVRDTWFPGWQATVNGSVTPIEKASPFFRAVKVPAGPVTIEMSYQPRWLYLGLMFSLVTLTGIIGTLLPLSKHAKPSHN